MDLGLRGRVVIVTGASSGIGLDTCRLLVEEGAAVLACARREKTLEAAVGELPTKSMLAIAGDVNDQEDMNAVVDAAMRRFGRIDGLACIAGRGTHGHSLDLSTDQWNREMSSKISGVTNIVRAARSHLAARRGRIVTITAPTGREPDPSMAAVSAGRAAVANLTRSLARDLAHEGIAVNAVSVGLIDTPRQQARHRAAKSSLTYEQWLDGESTRRGVPLERPGTSREVATLITLALSPALGYTTGSTLAATGGLAAG